MTNKQTRRHFVEGYLLRAGAFYTREAPKLKGKRALTAADFAGERSKFVRQAEVVSIDKEARTVHLAFSSEVEVDRGHYIEVLSHEPGACDLSRLNDGGAVLVGHDWNDQVGVNENATIDSDRRGRATVRLGRSARAEEIFQDVVDGIRRHVSVGYNVNTWKLVEEREHCDVYLMTSWTPYEISFVPVPADTSVGVGRSFETHVAIPETTAEAESAPTVQITENSRSNSVKTKNIRAANGDLIRVKLNDDGTIGETLEVLETADATRSLSTAGADAERARATTLRELGTQFDASDLADQFIGNGGTVDAMRSALRERSQRGTKPVADSRDLGASASELANFSIVRAIQALANPHDSRLRAAAEFEFALSERAAKRDGKDAKGFYVPFEVLAQQVRGAADGVSVGLAGATGGNLVPTNLLAGSFIEYLRNRCLAMQLATPLNGLVGNIDIPGQTSVSQGYWTSEGVPVSTTKPGFGKVSMSAKTVGGRTPITRKMLMQSPMAMEALVRADLAAAIAQTIDYAVFYGTGENDTPLGIANTPGITTQDFVGVDPSYAELVAMESKISASNADVDNMLYLANPMTRGSMKTTKKFPDSASDSVIWTGGRRDGEVNGYGAAVTNQIAHGDVFFGNFADVLMGFWGGLDIITDPYTDAGAGGIVVTALQDVDVALRRGASFCHGRKPA